jgi:hypothetical protein
MDWYYANGKNQSKIAKYFDKLYPNLKIKQLLVSLWLKDEEKWHREWDLNTAQSEKHACQTQHPEITEMIDLWSARPCPIKFN